jgi:hypothetical protein
MEQQFAVGDRVIVINMHLTGLQWGTLGTVTQVFADAPHICDVQFDIYSAEYAVVTRALAPAPTAENDSP